jgi:hypothetical protein
MLQNPGEQPHAASLSHRIRFCLSDLERKDLVDQAACSLSGILESCHTPQLSRTGISLLLSGVCRPLLAAVFLELWSVCTELSLF